MIHRTSRRLANLQSHLNPSSTCSASTSTHLVTNQATPLTNYNAYSDVALQHGIQKYNATWGSIHLTTLGNLVGSSKWQNKSRNANSNPPSLTTFDRFGNRIDAVQFQQDYHDIMKLGLSSGAASFAWETKHRGKEGAHVIRAGLMYLMYQLNPGTCCPITMTFAAVPALETGMRTHSTAFFDEIHTKLTTSDYNGDNIAIADKPAVTMGMSMTEKQGGSDVRANTTIATSMNNDEDDNDDDDDNKWSLTGHKWFTSAPMSDAFMTLAQTENGISCFIVPRWLSDGNTPNKGFQLQRLKDKMGDKSNASSEVEYRNCIGYLLGEEGRGIRTIVDMVVHTRLDCVIGSAALMRQCSQLATHHCMERNAFGKSLIDQPLMKALLSDLSIETESAMMLWMRLAASLDRTTGTTKDKKTRQHEAAFVRLATAVAKYWVCKRAPQVAYECMEIHGGNGYVEEGPMAALFRQSPLNAIWEGSGNVICLDVLRAVQKEPESAQALFQELESCFDVADEIGGNIYIETVRDIQRELLSSKEVERAVIEFNARSLVDRLAVCLAGCVLMQDGDPIVAKCYLKTRLPMNGNVVPHNLGGMIGNVGVKDQDIEYLIERMKTN